MASDVSPNWLRSVPSCTSRVDWRQALVPFLSSLAAPMGVTPFDWSQWARALKNPDLALCQKTGIGLFRLARPFSELFNVAASRPAKSPRGAFMALWRGGRQASPGEPSKTPCELRGEDRALGDRSLRKVPRPSSMQPASQSDALFEALPEDPRADHSAEGTRSALAR